MTDRPETKRDTSCPDSTAALIRDLARAPQPVRGIDPPLRRGLTCTAIGFAVSLALFAGAVLSGAAALDNVVLLLERWTVCLQLLATVMTAVAALLAAFQLSVPGAARRWLWLPVLPLGLWLVSLGATCWEDWQSLGHASLATQAGGDCVALLLLISLPLILGAAMQIRRAAPLDPALEGVLVALAGAAAASALVQLLFPFERGVQVLLWNFGPVLALAVLGGLLGSVLFSSAKNHQTSS